MEIIDNQKSQKKKLWSILSNLIPRSSDLNFASKLKDHKEESYEDRLEWLIYIMTMLVKHTLLTQLTKF